MLIMDYTPEKQKKLKDKILKQEEVEAFMDSDMYKELRDNRLESLITQYEKALEWRQLKEWEDISTYWLIMAYNHKVLWILKQLKKWPEMAIKSIKHSLKVLGSSE